MRNRAPLDRFGERSRQLPVAAAIALVATLVVGQLWALTVALDAWLGGDDAAARWIVLFQAVSFVVALLIWRAATPRMPRAPRAPRTR
jgi:hypothetical protein